MSDSANAGPSPEEQASKTDDPPPGTVEGPGGDEGSVPPAETEEEHPETEPPPSNEQSTEPHVDKAGPSVGTSDTQSDLQQDSSPQQGGAADQEQGGATPGKGTPPTTEQSQTTPTTEQATPPPPQHVFRDNWSQLSRDKLVDKVKGVIYGQAIGDALGLATEFMNKTEAAHYYGKEGPSHYSQIIHDFHRSRWVQGDWTDDTDQLLLILQMIVERGGTVDSCAFAKKMDNWRKRGFKELGDYGGMGIGMTVSNTLSHHSFLTDPHQAAHEVWEKSGRYLAANGAIMRTAILGVLEFNRLERVMENTREICLTTHADPRCLASCVAVTTAIALMLQGKYNPHQPKELEQLVTDALTFGQEKLIHKDQKKEFEKHVRAKKLKDLDLENAHTMGYTFKAAGAGFFGLRTASDFLPTLRKVIAEAGDADSNGAVCGALMGCKFGYSGLPEGLLAFQHRAWLDTQVDNFLTTIGLKDLKEQ
ncbi:Uncharacterized protein MJ1187 [Geodia barretti]|uniref:Uncharacterized protein MJ1187 n=1 Tax=Geodia barretti TaxID=519541 RepID=A0AA35TH29_GEOBA|nr:Uncharacterized protein MJ1187 [Geodia barretti]